MNVSDSNANSHKLHYMTVDNMFLVRQVLAMYFLYLITLPGVGVITTLSAIGSCVSAFGIVMSSAAYRAWWILALVIGLATLIGFPLAVMWPIYRELQGSVSVGDRWQSKVTASEIVIRRGDALHTYTFAHYTRIRACFGFIIMFSAADKYPTIIPSALLPRDEFMQVWRRMRNGLLHG